MSPHPMFPQPVLISRRLRLRPFRGDDAKPLLDLLNDPAVADFVHELPQPLSLPIVEEWIATTAEAWDRRVAVVHAVTIPTTDSIAGCVQVLLEVDAAEAELGYWIAPAHRGCGYASEVVETVARWCAIDLDLSVRARHAPTNTASARVLTRAGFVACNQESTTGAVSYQYLVSGLSQ